MKTALFLSLAVAFAVPLPAADDPAPKKDESKGKEVKLEPLTSKQQEALLASRAPGDMVGSFNSFASMLFALDNIVTHTDSEEIAEVRLHSPFPDFYKPTRAEFFNSMARQMSSSWSYDTKRAYWVFAKPPMPMPFKVTLAKGWESEERGNYLFCKPPTAPVGMDIYVMAEYSSTPPDPKLQEKMREAAAMLFAQNFKKGITAKEMTVTKVGAYDALHLKASPRPGVMWRQWAIAEDGQSFVIVSAIDEANEKDVLPGVEEMLKTFELKKREQPKGGAAQPAK